MLFSANSVLNIKDVSMTKRMQAKRFVGKKGKTDWESFEF
jgi:hypothetical protein